MTQFPNWDVVPINGYEPPSEVCIELWGYARTTFGAVTWMTSSEEDKLRALADSGALDDPDLEVWARPGSIQENPGGYPARQTLARYILDEAISALHAIDHSAPSSEEDAAIMAAFLHALSRWQEESEGEPSYLWMEGMPAIWEILRHVVAHPHLFRAVPMPDARAWPNGGYPGTATLGE